jgi:putative membrane protein
VLVGVTTFFSELQTRSFSSVLLSFLLIGGILFLVEFIGVKTGFPFGNYQYTDALGLTVFGVPPAIAFAWYATVMNTRRIAEWSHGNVSAARIAIAAGFLTLALDIVLEPTAAFIKNYWLWSDGVVPTQNYVSWFLLGALVVFITIVSEKQAQRHASDSVHHVALVLFASQFTLFALTNVAHGYVAATLAACIFVAVVAFFRVKHDWFFAAKGAA